MGKFCRFLAAALLLAGAWQAVRWAARGQVSLSAPRMSPGRAQQAQESKQDETEPGAAQAAGLDTAALDAFCAAQPGHFSVYLGTLDGSTLYTHDTEMLYYPASTLKAAYALWLCQQADEGLIDLEGEIPNYYYGGELAATPLAEYAASAAVPAWKVLHAMIAQSSNEAMRLLAASWPGDASGGFVEFLRTLGFGTPDACAITWEGGIDGVMSVADAGRMMSALAAYFETDTSTAIRLRQCFLDAEHTALYIPEGVPAAKKYGSWDYAFHDLAIVYADTPYILCCMTDQGDRDIDFPAAPVEAMQQFGELVYTQLNPGAE